MGPAGVGDCLGGEEELVFGDGVVECSVEGLVAGGAVRGVGWVFEEEDDAVDGVELGQGGGVEGEEFFELDVADAEVG